MTIKNVIFFAAGFLLLGVAACKSKTYKALPVALSDTVPITVPVSSFRIPISYSLASLQEFLNQKIKGRFLETTLSPTKNEKDKVKVEMAKMRNIIIKPGKNELICHIPLQVTATILNSRINFITKGIKPVVTEVDLELRTPVDLDKDWHLLTRFRLADIDWVKPPVVKIAGIKFNLTEKLDAFLQQNKDKLTVLLDTEIKKAVSLEKPVEKIWLDLQKPMVVVKKPPRAFIRFICRSISGDFKLQGDELVCFTHIKAQVAMVSETKLKAPVIPLPRFSPVAQKSNLSDAWVYAFVEFEQVNTALESKLKGKEFKGKNFSTRVKDVKTYASDSGLTVLLETKGDIDATMAATVRPRFDSVSQTFSMDNFQFQVVSENVLINMGDALLHDKVRDTVQTYLSVGLDTLIKKIPGIIEGAISKGKTGKAIDLDISDFKIISCGVKMGAKRLHLLVHVSLKSEIELKRIGAGRGIKIKVKEKGKGKVKVEDKGKK